MSGVRRNQGSTAGDFCLIMGMIVTAMILFSYIMFLLLGVVD